MKDDLWRLVKDHRMQKNVLFLPKVTYESEGLIKEMTGRRIVGKKKGLKRGKQVFVHDDAAEWLLMMNPANAVRKRLGMKA